MPSSFNLFLNGVRSLRICSRFSMVLGAQLKSGIPITQAVKITADVLSNFYYKKELTKIIAVVEGGVVTRKLVCTRCKRTQAKKSR